MEGIRWVLAVPYIPVQGSPGVFRESLGVGNRVFGWVIIICGVKVAYMRVVLKLQGNVYSPKDYAHEVVHFYGKN